MVESDHRLAVIKIRYDNAFARKSFRFDKRMADNPDFKTVIMKGWNDNQEHSSMSINRRIRNVAIIYLVGEEMVQTTQQKRYKILYRRLILLTQIRKSQVRNYRDSGMS